MNVRLSKTSIRFRISSDELNSALHRGTVTESTPLPPDGQELRYEMVVGVFPRVLALAHADRKISLLVSRVALNELAERLPSKQGLVGTEHIREATLNISLEVDIKS